MNGVMTTYIAIPQTTTARASGSGMNCMPATVVIITPWVVTYQLGRKVSHWNRRTKNRTKETTMCTSCSPNMQKKSIRQGSGAHCAKNTQSTMMSMLTVG